MTRNKQDTDKYSSGFTTVELLLTIIVAALFATVFLDTFSNISRSNAEIKHESLADNVAYSILRKYVAIDVRPNSWFTCDTSSGSGNQNDRAVNPSAPGSVIASGAIDPIEAGLPGPVNYTVTALAIYGCAGTNNGKPIRVQADVTYGTTNRHMTHVALVGY